MLSTKVNWKRFLSLEWAIIAVLLIVAGIFAWKAYHAPKKVKNDVQNLKAIKDAPVKHETDDAGRDHGIKEVAKPTREEVDLVWGQEKKELLDAINSKDKLIKVKDKQLEAFYITGTHTEFNVTPEVKKVYINNDTNYQFDWHNTWTKIDGTVGPTAKTLHYRHDDTMSTAFYWERKIPIIGRKYTYMNASMKDTGAHITGMQAVQIQDLGYDKFRFDAYAGYQSNFMNNNVAAGLSGEYFLTKRTSLEGSFQYQYGGATLEKELRVKLKFTLAKF